MVDNTRALLWQGFFCLAMFVSTFICYLLPIIIFSRRNRRLQGNEFATEEDFTLPHHWSNVNLTNQLKKYRLKRLLSYCNCVSAGVFLGVCFLNLIPCVEDEFAKLIKDYDSLKRIVGTFPLGQFTVICGLFFVLILESLLSGCFKTTKETQPINSSTVPILYLDEESNEQRLDINDELSYDQEELLLSNETTEEVKPNGRRANQPQNGMNGHRGLSERSRRQDDLFSDTHQHGHGHSHFSADLFQDRPDSMLSFFILMFATSIHSLFEGLALGLQSDISNAIHLFIGIILHECLVAVALGLNAVRLQQQNINLLMHVKFAFLFSLTIPVGNIFGILLGYTPGHIGRFISAIFQGFAAGTFIHVTFLELIPEELLSSECDTKEDELAKLISDNQTDDNVVVDANTNVPAEASDSIEPETSQPDHRHNHNSGSSLSELSHTHHGNTKLRKIMLLLLGFIIMTLVPFLFNE